MTWARLWGAVATALLLLLAPGQGRLRCDPACNLDPLSRGIGVQI
jgi:hypothetical protein